MGSKYHSIWLSPIPASCSWATIASASARICASVRPYRSTKAVSEGTAATKKVSLIFSRPIRALYSRSNPTVRNVHTKAVTSNMEILRTGARRVCFMLHLANINIPRFPSLFYFLLGKNRRIRPPVFDRFLERVLGYARHRPFPPGRRRRGRNRGAVCLIPHPPPPSPAGKSAPSSGRSIPPARRGRRGARSRCGGRRSAFHRDKNPPGNPGSSRIFRTG